MEQLECPNKRCRYKWKYIGKNKFYTLCPRCNNRVRIKGE